MVQGLIDRGRAVGGALHGWVCRVVVVVAVVVGVPRGRWRRGKLGAAVLGVRTFAIDQIAAWSEEVCGASHFVEAGIEPLVVGVHGAHVHQGRSLLCEHLGTRWDRTHSPRRRGL